MRPTSEVRSVSIGILVLLITIIHPATSFSDWQQTAVPPGQFGADVTSLVVVGPKILAGVAYGGIYASTDSGTSWFRSDSGITFPYVFSWAVGGNRVFAGTGNGVFVSTDEGTSWSSVSAGLPAGSEILSIVIHDSNLFACHGYRVYTSTNWGGAWVRADSGMPNSIVHALEICGPRIFAGTDGSGIYVTTNNGITWTPSNSGLVGVGQTVCSLFNHGTGLFAGTYFGGTFASTDSGSTWSAVDSGLTNRSVQSFYDIGSNLFASTGLGGVFLSTNDGVQWMAVNSGLPSVSVQSLVSFGTYLFAATSGAGVWRRPLAEILTSVESHEENLPGGYFLAQNYPNPFNPTTSIAYTVGGVRNQASGFSMVNLAVYDLLGREVAVLVNEQKLPGSYSVQFDGAKLASGVYFYQLTAGPFTQTRRMVVMK